MRGTTRAKARQGDHGLSLIELVVAMALFALVAVMGLQGLSGSLRLGDRLRDMDRETAALGFAVDVLRNDLTAIVPMLFFPPGARPPVSALSYSGDGQSLAMSLGGQPTLDGETRNMRAQWRLAPADGTLRRQVWPLLTPATAATASPERVILSGVTEVTVESYWSGFGWVPGVTIPGVLNAPTATIDEDQAGSAPEVYSDLLPLAVAVVITTERYGEIRLVEGLQ